MNFKIRIVPSDKGCENAPDFRVVACNGLKIGAASAYLSVTLDDPSFPATIFAHLVDEGEDDTHNLIWSRSKGD